MSQPQVEDDRHTGPAPERHDCKLLSPEPADPGGTQSSEGVEEAGLEADAGLPRVQQGQQHGPGPFLMKHLDDS